jgi:hypothetical protein
MVDKTTNKIKFNKKLKVQISNINTLSSYELDPSENMLLLIRLQTFHNPIPLTSEKQEP